MKKTTIIISLFVLLLTSCLGDDTIDYDYSSDTAITDFSLGTLKRRMYTKASDGLKDSTYMSNVVCSKYKFCIDHEKGLIYNEDSLPVRTDISKVLCTVNAYNGSAIGYKKPDNDTIFNYNAADSLDFTKSLEFRVYAADGTSYRPYKTSINVHQQYGDSLYWTNMGNIGSVPAKCKMIAKDGAVFVFDLNVDKDVMLFNNSFYAIHGEALQKSSDGSSWTTVAEEFPFNHLIAAGSTMIFAISDDNSIWQSADGKQWIADVMEGDEDYLPLENIYCFSKTVKSNLNTEKIIVVGNSPADADKAVVWTKIIEKSPDSKVYPWSRISYTRDTDYSLPKELNLSVAYYDDNLISVQNGKFLVSRDEGLLWQNDKKDYYLPEGFSQEESSVVVASSAEHLWILEQDGTLWRGLFNRLAWTRQDKKN